MKYKIASLCLTVLVMRHGFADPHAEAGSAGRTYVTEASSYSSQVSNRSFELWLGDDCRSETTPQCTQGYSDACGKRIDGDRVVTRHQCVRDPIEEHAERCRGNDGEIECGENARDICTLNSRHPGAARFHLCGANQQVRQVYTQPRAAGTRTGLPGSTPVSNHASRSSRVANSSFELGMGADCRMERAAQCTEGYSDACGKRIEGSRVVTRHQCVRDPIDEHAERCRGNDGEIECGENARDICTLNLRRPGAARFHLCGANPRRVR
jgi:hypothetical protein